MKPQHFTTADARASLAGQKGGQITGELRKGATLSRLSLLYLGSSLEGLREAYDIGYRAGHAAKTRTRKTV